MSLPVLRRRRTIVQIFAVVAVLSFLFSMGPRVIVANHHTALRGPYDVLAHLPVLGDIIPSRFARWSAASSHAIWST